jgi:tRNA (guanine-N7-)-methyltransferase
MYMGLILMINLKDLPFLWPHDIDWAQFFYNPHPLDIEIGCGRAHFFFDRLKNYPHRNMVGIEWKYEFVAQAEKRRIQENISHGLVLHGNAWLLVPLLFAAQSISCVFVNFPDPWWKNRHKKRLVLNEVFLHELRSRMKANGTLVLQTDVLELFLFYQTRLNNHGFALDNAMTNNDIIAHNQAHTHREKKCLALGLPIYRGLFRIK